MRFEQKQRPFGVDETRAKSPLHIIYTSLSPALQKEKSEARALAGSFDRPVHGDDAILLVESETIAATLRGIDAALKAVPVVLSTWRLGRGIAGRGLFALRGEHANLEAAESVLLEAAGAGLRETQLIPRPDPLGLWSRPFGGDQL